MSRKFTTFTELGWVKYVVIHRDLLDIAFPVGRAQLADVEGILATEGAILVVRAGPLEIWRLMTFCPASVS